MVGSEAGRGADQMSPAGPEILGLVVVDGGDDRHARDQARRQAAVEIGGQHVRVQENGPALGEPRPEPRHRDRVDSAAIGHAVDGDARGRELGEPGLDRGPRRLEQDDQLDGDRRGGEGREEHPEMVLRAAERGIGWRLVEVDQMGDESCHASRAELFDRARHRLAEVEGRAARLRSARQGEAQLLVARQSREGLAQRIHAGRTARAGRSGHAR